MKLMGACSSVTAAKAGTDASSVSDYIVEFRSIRVRPKLLLMRGRVRSGKRTIGNFTVPQKFRLVALPDLTLPLPLVTSSRFAAGVVTAGVVPFSTTAMATARNECTPN